MFPKKIEKRRKNIKECKSKIQWTWQQAMDMTIRIIIM